LERALYAVRALGRLPLMIIRLLGDFGIFFGKAVFWTFTPPLKVDRLLKQINFIGTKSLSIIALTGGFTGMVLALETFYAMQKFGAEALLGPTVALSMIRELGPVISALMITARAGSALTAGIGIMRITEQIDAISSSARIVPTKGI